MFESLNKEMAKQHIKPFTLAKQADINPSDLYSALKGNRPMFPKWRKRISGVLDVPEEMLFSESEADHEQENAER